MRVTVVEICTNAQGALRSFLARGYAHFASETESFGADSYSDAHEKETDTVWCPPLFGAGNRGRDLHKRAWRVEKFLALQKLRYRFSFQLSAAIKKEARQAYLFLYWCG